MGWLKVILHGWRYIFRIRYIPSYLLSYPKFISQSLWTSAPAYVISCSLQIKNSKIFKNFIRFQNFLKISKIQKFNKFQNVKIFKKFQKLHKISKFSRILCNKTITTLQWLERDQYGKKNILKKTVKSNKTNTALHCMRYHVLWNITWNINKFHKTWYRMQWSAIIV